MVGFHPKQCSMFLIHSSTHRVKNFVPPNWAAPTAKAYWYQRLSVTL